MELFLNMFYGFIVIIGCGLVVEVIGFLFSYYWWVLFIFFWFDRIYLVLRIINDVLGCVIVKDWKNYSSLY